MNVDADTRKRRIAISMVARTVFILKPFKSLVDDKSLADARSLTDARISFAVFEHLAKAGGYYRETRPLEVFPGNGCAYVLMKRADGPNPAEYIAGHPEKAHQLLDIVARQIVLFDSCFKTDFDGKLIDGVKLEVYNPFQGDPVFLANAFARSLNEIERYSRMSVAEKDKTAIFGPAVFIQSLMQLVPFSICLLDCGNQNNIVHIRGKQIENHKFDFDNLMRDKDDVYRLIQLCPFFSESAVFDCTVNRQLAVDKLRVSVADAFVAAFSEQHQTDFFFNPQNEQNVRLAKSATYLGRAVRMLGHACRDYCRRTRNNGEPILHAYLRHRKGLGFAYQAPLEFIDCLGQELPLSERGRFVSMRAACRNLERNVEHLLENAYFE
ncbi:MAG: hypothetical protein V1659_05180 [Candidatus Woesearchaeota archaeon]